jgi:hypothetical protein
MGMTWSACEKPGMETQQLEAGLPDFREIRLSSTFELYLTEDTLFSIRIVADDDFIKHVVYEVIDSVLTLKVDSKRLWLKPKENKIKVFVHAHQLRLIHADETSYVTTTNPITSPEFGIIMKSKLQEADLELNCNTFYYWNVHPCGGKLTLRGTVQNLKLWNEGLMSVDGSGLTTSYALMENKSKGDCRLHVTDKLEYSIFGQGNIYVAGDPPVLQAGLQTGSGQLILEN